MKLLTKLVKKTFDTNIILAVAIHPLGREKPNEKEKRTMKTATTESKLAKFLIVNSLMAVRGTLDPDKIQSLRKLPNFHPIEYLKENINHHVTGMTFHEFLDSVKTCSDDEFDELLSIYE